MIVCDQLSQTTVIDDRIVSIEAIVCEEVLPCDIQDTWVRYAPIAKSRTSIWSNQAALVSAEAVGSRNPMAEFWV